MDLKDILSLSTSLASFFISFLLFILNSKTLKEIRNQNQYLRRSMKSETIERIHSAHRDLFLTILNDDDYIKLFDSSSDDVDIMKKNFLATFYVNNTFTAFYYYKQGFIDDTYWNGYQNDIIETFRSPFFRKRWEEIKLYHDKDFQDFIENLISRGIKYSNSKNKIRGKDL